MQGWELKWKVCVDLALVCVVRLDECLYLSLAGCYDCSQAATRSTSLLVASNCPGTHDRSKSASF
jgi:hypothetical protein